MRQSLRRDAGLFARRVHDVMRRGHHRLRGRLRQHSDGCVELRSVQRPMPGRRNMCRGHVLLRRIRDRMRGSVHEYPDGSTQLRGLRPSLRAGPVLRRGGLCGGVPLDGTNLVQRSLRRSPDEQCKLRRVREPVRRQRRVRQRRMRVSPGRFAVRQRLRGSLHERYELWSLRNKVSRHRPTVRERGLRDYVHERSQPVRQHVRRPYERQDELRVLRADLRGQPRLPK